MHQLRHLENVRLLAAQYCTREPEKIPVPWRLILNGHLALPGQHFTLLCLNRLCIPGILWVGTLGGDKEGWNGAELYPSYDQNNARGDFAKEISWIGTNRNVSSQRASGARYTHRFYHPVRSRKQVNTIQRQSLRDFWWSTTPTSSFLSMECIYILKIPDVARIIFLRRSGWMSE